MSVERVDIKEAGSPWAEEHLARYVFVIDRIKNKRVLDIACGTGFGSELMIKNGAQSVYAADISEEAIELCKRKFEVIGRANDVCHIQDGTQMSYPNNYFDVVLSFETIEHIPQYQLFIQEIYRVLKPDGILVLSTPNAIITNPDNGVPKNPFHIYEFKPEEMMFLLSTHFSIELAAGQHVISSYGVAPFLPSFKKNTLTFKQRVNFIYWRIALRLPDFIKNQLHKIFFSSTFYPSVNDYSFLTENLDRAHVQYYICKRKN